MESESTSGGGPGGEDGARAQGGAGRGSSHFLGLEFLLQRSDGGNKAGYAVVWGRGSDIRDDLGDTAVMLTRHA
jgi:hypothetical protein